MRYEYTLAHPLYSWREPGSGLNSTLGGIAALISWGSTWFDYLLQVPANRIGYTTMNLAQLKILQDVITLRVFVPCAMLCTGQEIKMNYLYAGL